MILRGPPPADVSGQQVSLRAGTAEDAGFVRSCLAEAFGLPPQAFVGEEPSSRSTDMLVITSKKQRVGVMRVDQRGQSAGIYGFAITPVLQGRGYGQAALAAVCRSLLGGGVDEVHLEVSVVNPSALHVYERCGFEVVGTEDYYLVR